MLGISVLAKANPLIDVPAWSRQERVEMLSDFAKALEKLQPKDSRYLARAGHLLLRAGRVQEAAETFERSLQADRNDDEAWIIIANAFTDASMWSEADVWFKRAVDRDPSDSDHRIEWGVSLWNRGEHERATEMFSQALGNEPSEARLYYKMGMSMK